MGNQQTTAERTVSTRDRPEPTSRIAERLSLSTLTAILWMAVIAASAMDVLTTTIGLRRGLSEGNVLTRTLVETVGVAGFGGLKLAALVVLAATWYLVDDRQGYAALAGFGGVTIVVVVVNVITIATA